MRFYGNFTLRIPYAARISIMSIFYVEDDTNIRELTLYALGPECGGNFVYTEDGIKDCSGCMIPHSKNAYEHIMEKTGLLIEMAKKK